MSLSLAGTLDQARGTGHGLVGGQTASTWTVQFPPQVPLVADFGYEPTAPVPTGRIRFLDRTKSPQGLPLTQTWLVDGVKDGSGPI